MGLSCSIGGSESGLHSHLDDGRQHLLQTPTEDYTAMTEGSSEFDKFKECCNYIWQFGEKINGKCDELSRHYREMKKRNEELKAEIENLRKRISNDSEMNQRSDQSSCEDTSSKNRRSNVLHQYRVVNGATRKGAMEVLGKTSNRAQIWYRKDLTCRIFLTAYEIAKNAKETFDGEAIPRFFKNAPSVGLHLEENFSQAKMLFEQQILEDEQQVLTTKSFKVACSSVLKELAVDCDLTHLEKKFLGELVKRSREEWKKSYPWLPCLDDEMMKNKKMKTFISDCLRLAWRMVTLLPPLKIETIDGEKQKKLKDYFEVQVEDNKENSETMSICVWPIVIDCDSNEVLEKGEVAIIPKPKTQQLLVKTK